MNSPSPANVKLPGHIKARPFPRSVYTRAVDIARECMGGKIIPGMKLPGLKQMYESDYFDGNSAFLDWVLINAERSIEHDTGKSVR